MRFTGDKLVPSDRFDELRSALGDGLVVIEIPSPDAKWDISAKAHSVITEEVDHDRPDHPATKAFHEVLDFLAERLTV